MAERLTYHAPLKLLSIHSQTGKILALCYTLLTKEKAKAPQMFTLFHQLPRDLKLDNLSSFLGAKNIYRFNRALATTSNSNKTLQQEAILSLCYQQSQESIVGLTLIFANPAHASLFETAEEIHEIRTALEKSMLSPFSTLVHQLAGKLFIAKVMSKDFNLTEDIIPDIFALFDKNPNTLRALLPYIDKNTQKNILTKVAKKLTEGVDFRNHKALERLESFVSQLDDATLYFSLLLPILTEAMNYTKKALPAEVACRILTALFLQVNNSRRLDIISIIIKSFRKFDDISQLFPQAVQAFTVFLSQTQNEKARSSIITALLQKQSTCYKFSNTLIIWKVLLAVLIQPNGCPEILRLEILSVFNNRVRINNRTYFNHIVVNALSVLSHASENEHQELPSTKDALSEIILSEADRAVNDNTMILEDRLDAMEALETFAPQIIDTEGLESFFSRLIVGLKDPDIDFRRASIKVLRSFLSHEEKRPMIKTLLIDILRHNTQHARVFYVALETLTSLLPQENDTKLLSFILDHLLLKLNDETAEEQDSCTAFETLAALVPQANNSESADILGKFMAGLRYRNGEKVPLEIIIEPLVARIFSVSDPKKSSTIISAMNYLLENKPAETNNLSEQTLIKIIPFANPKVHDILSQETSPVLDYLSTLKRIEDVIEISNRNNARACSRP